MHQGLVTLTVVLHYEDIDILQARMAERLEAEGRRSAETDGMLAELGLDRQARLLPSGVKVLLGREAPAVTPHVIRGWIARAQLITGDLRDMLSERQRLLNEGRSLGLLRDDVEADDFPFLSDPGATPEPPHDDDEETGGAE